MALWGGAWGAAWGIPAGPGPAALCTLADGRILVQMDDTPGTRNFRDYICDLVYDAGTFQDVAAEVKAAFNVDVTQGVHLDAIGSVVGLTRQGFDDNDYRRFLKIQIEILLSGARDDAEWTGTHENILRIARTFIGTGIPDPIILINLPPYSFLITVPGVSLADMQVLATFIRTAIYAGVLGQAIIPLAADSLWGSASVGPIAGEGIFGSASVVVAGAAILGTVVPI